MKPIHVPAAKSINAPAALISCLSVGDIQHLIRQLKQRFEEKTGWGDSDLWNNQDFLELSLMICEQTGASLSHVTLKRIWGKVRYESLPHTNTLNTLARFLGYRNWREFRVKNAEARPY